MIKSAGIAILVTAFSILLAYPIAYYVAFDIGSRKLLWLIIFTLPSWISYLLRILSWKLILGHNGVVNTAFIQSGIIAEPLEFLLYNSTAVMIALNALMGALCNSTNLRFARED